MNDHELVRTAIREIFLKNGYDPGCALAQRDFEFICQEIEEHTRTLISVSTLKRLQNSDFSRIPQVATLNALVLYLGFGNWQAYKAAKRKETIEHPTPELAIAKRRPGKRTINIPRKWLVAATVLLMAIVAFGIVSYRGKQKLAAGALYFSARKTTGNAIPNTVVFNYDVSHIKADSFFIQQSWDKRRRVKIDPKIHVLTDVYFEPGYHVAKIFANDSVLKTVDVSIPTDGWIAYTSSFFGKQLPQYIKTGKTLAEVNGAVNDAGLQTNYIRTDEHTVFVCASFPGVLIGDGDNFTCHIRARLTDARTRQCPFLMFEICCQRRFMYFTSMNKGCSGEALAQFGDQLLNGKTTDLSPLCFDLQQWTDIDWQVKDKKVSISINGKKAFETTYNTTCGKVAGIGLISNGFCEWSSVQLKGHDGNGISGGGFVGR